MQFAAVVAYFYRFEASEADRKDTIDAAILQEAARLADRKRPGLARMTLTNAKNAGFLDVIAPGKYRINSVGENLVAMTLPGNGLESPPRRIRSKKKAHKKKTQGNKMQGKKTTKPGR